MANLLLYSGITPNTSNKHYLYSDIASFKTALQNHLFKTVVIDNYRINAGIIKVKIDETLTLSNYKNITYAINEKDNVCYVVRSSVIQSGFVIYDCDVDYWGTYIAQANLSHINILRCNRNVDIGVYDDIKATKNNVQTRFEIPNGNYVIDTTQTPPREYRNSYKFSNTYIVFCLTYNVEQTGYGGVSATGMYAFNLQDVYDKYITDTPDGIYENPINIARAWVGGIYGVTATSALGFATTTDARVTKAYLLPKELVYAPYQYPSIITVTSKSMYGNYGVGNPLDVREVSNIERIHTKVININPNYNYYVGTINKGLKVTRDTSGATPVSYVSLVKNNSVQIIVKQGDNQQDITSEFEVDLTMNDGDITNLAGIKEALNTSLGFIGGVASQNYLTSGLGAVGAVGSLIGRHYHGKQAGNGDGVLTFYDAGLPSLGIGLVYPYGYTTCESTSDEQANARQKGAYYDCYVDTLNEIFNYNFIGTGTSNDATFVQANLSVDNVPMQAINEIQSKLSKGVYLIKL